MASQNDRNIHPDGDTSDLITQNTRIYIRSTPTRQSSQQLVRLQDGLQRMYPDAKTVATYRLHLTLLHLGKPGDLLMRIRRRNPDLTDRTFKHALGEFIKVTKDVIPDSYALPVRGLEWFGGNSNVLALELRSDRRFEAACGVAARAVYSFLRCCGIEDTAGYITSDPNLRYVGEIHPHITLLRSTSRMDLPRELPLPDQIRLQPTTHHKLRD